MVNAEQLRTAKLWCEHEPIHIPGFIQPHGVLLAVEAHSGRVAYVSANADSVFGISADDVVNARFDALLPQQIIERLALAVSDLAVDAHSYVANVVCGAAGRSFDIAMHRVGSWLVYEFEPSSAALDGQLELLAAIRSSVAEINDSRSITDLSSIIVRRIADLTNFDRVMMYRFDRDWNGEVIAEQCSAALEPYLGLRYPASDIPRQARELYRRSFLRLIPDAKYAPVHILPARDVTTDRPLDLSLALLRSISPVHLEYLANMQVQATLTISLLKNGALWGLIAAHNRTPRGANYHVRVGAELIGRAASLQIAAIEEQSENARRLYLRSLQPALVGAVDREGEFVEAVAVDALLSITGASGAAVKTEGEPRIIGNTPRDRDIRRVIAWLDERDASLHDEPYATDCLPLQNPDFTDFRNVACGLLALPLTSTVGGWILWFRPEVVATVNWGGDPHKALVDDGTRISPRKSFARWKETVGMHAVPWSDAEIDAAAELRRLLSEVMMRRAREYAKLNAELRRSNQELESFAHIASHDLREPLRGIRHYAKFLHEDFGSKIPEEGARMLDSIVDLTDRMAAQIQSLLELAEVSYETDIDYDVDADAVLDEVLRLLGPQLQQVTLERSPLTRVKMAGPKLREVFLNLIGNALKYCKPEDKRFSIALADEHEPPHRIKPPNGATGADMATIVVRDNGIGISEKHLEIIFRMFKRLHARDAYGGGTGAGLAIVRKIIEQQGGIIWVESILGKGSSFFFSIPRSEAR